MDKITAQITMLGTGNATVSQIYNTCFVLQTSSTLMLVDAGGGNGILAQLKKVIKTIIDMILAKKQLAKVAERVVFHQLEDGDCFEVGDMKLECFDIQSTKEKQFGFRAELPSSSDESGKPLVLACLGDEPYNEQNRRYIVGADWMMCEAFCLYADRDTFKPYEKCHSTALDAGKLAEELGVKNLILYHTEEKTLANRKENYTREAAENFKGRIFVPDDLEVIEL